MLNPVSVSLSATDANDPQVAGTALDVLTAAAVTAAKAVAGILLNQITIVPLGVIYDGTNYVASATVLYSTS